MTEKEDFNEAITIIREMAERFKKIEGRPWGAEGTAIEMTKQVGELCALIMTREGYYFNNRDKIGGNKYSVQDKAIADELFDILFATIRMADHYGINLVQAAREEQINNAEWFRSKGLDF
jgi:NTP pyrophosphatase (non-canonical NTP hydrolase)